MAPTSLSNVGQVSVLKGPQGTLFGRNSTAGIIQMTTRDPSAHFGGEVSNEIDNYLTSRSEEHTSELQSLMRISSAVFCLKKKNNRRPIPERKTTYNISHNPYTNLII